MTPDEVKAAFGEPTYDRIREFYITDVKEWRASNPRNEERWQRLSKERKLAIAALYREGKGLYTIESCIAGYPELVFDPSKKKKVNLF